MIELLLGVVANVTSMSLWLPQAIRTYKSKGKPNSLQGLSLVTLYLGLINTLTWGIYGVWTGDFWIGIGTVIIAPSTIVIILWKKEADSLLEKQACDDLTELTSDKWRKQIRNRRLKK